MKSQVTRRTFIGTAGTLAAAGTGTTLAADSLAADSPDAAEGKPVKVLGICCSPRPGKSTATALKVCLAAAEEAGVEVELIELAGRQIPGDVAAGVPLAEGQRDDFPELAPRISDPAVAGIILGTPVYFGNMSSLCKSLLDRFNVFRRNFALSNKVGGVLSVGGSRNGGQELTLRSVQTALMGQEMIIVGDARPTSHCGATLWSGAPGGVTNDEAGLNTAKNLGRRVAEVALRVAR